MIATGIRDTKYMLVIIVRADDAPLTSMGASVMDKMLDEQGFYCVIDCFVFRAKHDKAQSPGASFSLPDYHHKPQCSTVNCRPYIGQEDRAACFGFKLDACIV